MTQSAVSQQIKALETQLGQPLFRRINRGVELTDAGRDLRTTAAATLETLRLGVRRLDFYTKPGSAVVSMPPAFCAGWCLPRLPALMQDLPGIEPLVVTLDTEPDFTHSEVDFAVRHGPNSGHRRSWDGFIAVKLFDDALQPMCAPALRARMPAEITPRTLQDFPLLHHEEEEDWQRWFAENGIARPGFVKVLNFSDAGLALDADARGHGICLGRQCFAAERLANAAWSPLAAQSPWPARPIF